MCGSLAAQQEKRDPRFFRSKREAAAGGEIKLGQIAHGFGDQRPDAAAAQGIDGGAQQFPCIACQHEQAVFGCAAQIAPAFTMDHSG